MDGEINISISKKIENKNVIIIGSTQPPAENLLELFLLIDTAVRNGAKRVEVIIPYFGYARSDKEDGKIKLASSKTIVKILESVGGNNCNFTIIDPHSKHLQQYFLNSFKEININKLITNEFNNIKDLFIVAPDRGSKNKAQEYASYLNIPEIVCINKKRISNNKVKILSISGNTSKNALIVDDMISSGNTIIETAKILNKRGVKNIYVAVTHIVYSAKGWKNILSSKLIKKIVTTNSIFLPKKLPKKIVVIQLTNILNNYISSL